MNLKEMLDNFGWEKMRQGQLPSEIKPEADNFAGGVHQYDLYALNGVCVITEDNRNIVELSFVEKTQRGYERKVKTPVNTIVKVGDMEGFLSGFKHLYGFRHRFVYVREHDMHFDGIGKRMEESEEL